MREDSRKRLMNGSLPLKETSSFRRKHQPRSPSFLSGGGAAQGRAGSVVPGNAHAKGLSTGAAPGLEVGGGGRGPSPRGAEKPAGRPVRRRASQALRPPSHLLPVAVSFLFCLCVSLPPCFLTVKPQSFGKSWQVCRRSGSHLSRSGA